MTDDLLKIFLVISFCASLSFAFFEFFFQFSLSVHKRTYEIINEHDQGLTSSGRGVVEKMAKMQKEKHIQRRLSNLPDVGDLLIVSLPSGTIIKYLVMGFSCNHLVDPATYYYINVLDLTGESRSQMSMRISDYDSNSQNITVIKSV